MTTAKKRRIKSSTKKVWRIFRFAKRYELRDDERKCRQSGLLFTRDFVSDAAGDEAAGYYQQLAMLDNGDGERFCLLFGLYRRLVNEAGKRSRAYRGYLIDADEQPLSDAAIGRLMKINAKRISSLLHKLEAVRLLEHVTMPDKFDTSLNEAPKESKEQSAGSVRKRNKSPKSGGGRKRAEKSGGGRKPLKETKTATATTTKTINSTSTEISNEQFDNGNKRKKNSNRQRVSQHSSALKSETNRKSTTTTTPATTPQIMPKASDAEGSNVIKFAKASPGSVQYNRSGPQVIGDVIAGIEHRYDRSAQQFAREIYQALCLPWHVDSIQAKREIGSFASLLSESRRWKLSDSALAELWARSHSEAQRIAKRKDKNRKPAAIWCAIFKKLLTSQCSKNQQAIS